MDIDYVDITGVYSLVEELYRKTTLETITYRFLHPVADVTHIYRYLWSRGCRSFLIYYNNKPVGIIDITPCGNGVEVAVLVIDSYQGKGLGKYVVLDFAQRLKNMGFAYALAYVAPENYKALAIARKIGAEVRCRDVCFIKYWLSDKDKEMCR